MILGKAPIFREGVCSRGGGKRFFLMGIVRVQGHHMSSPRPSAQIEEPADSAGASEPQRARALSTKTRRKSFPQGASPVASLSFI